MNLLASGIPSPCVNVCQMDADTALCVGCFRTIDEIAQWSGAAECDKLAILAAIEKRREAHNLVVAPGRDVRGDCNR